MLCQLMRESAGEWRKTSRNGERPISYAIVKECRYSDLAMPQAKVYPWPFQVCEPIHTFFPF